MRVCLYVCHCPGPISKEGWGAYTRWQPAQVHLSSADSVVKYFSVALQPPTVKLGGKSEPQTSSLEIYIFFFFRFVCHQYSCHFFQFFSFVVSSFLPPTSVFWWWQTPSLKCVCFSCQGKGISHNTSCHDKPICYSHGEVPRAERSSNCSRCCSVGVPVKNIKCLFLFIMSHF